MTKHILIAAAAALASSAAAAEDIVVVAPPIERVSYSDLDLSSPVGVDVLESRIRSAAANVCVEQGVKPLAVKRLEKSCLQLAVADGLGQAEQVIEAQRERRELAASTILIRAR